MTNKIVSYKFESRETAEKWKNYIRSCMKKSGVDAYTFSKLTINRFTVYYADDKKANSVMVNFSVWNHSNSYETYHTFNIKIRSEKSTYCRNYSKFDF